MSVTASSTSAPSGPYLGRVSGVTGTPNVRTGTYTLAVRAKWNTTVTNADMYLATLTVQSDGRGVYVMRANGKGAGVITMRRYNGVFTVHDADTSSSYNNTDWFHYALTYDGSTVRAYVNGVAGGTVSSSSTTLASGTADALSCAGPSSADAVDCVMFSRALSAAEVALLAANRLPTVGIGDCFLWVPMFAGASLSDCGVDRSGFGNNCTLQQSGSGNPVSSNENPPTPWDGRRSRVWVPSATVVAIAADGSTQTTGTAALSSSAGLAASGTVNTTGASAMTKTAGLAAAGSTQTTGAAALAASAALASSGTTQTSGTAANTVTIVHTASGTTQSTGAAALTAVAAVAASGSTQTTGSATMTASASIAAAGSTQTTGAANLAPNGAIVASGTTQTTGAASLMADFPAASSGTTQTTGAAAVALGAQVIAAGTTQTNGIASVTVSVALAATGSTSTSGSASFAGAAGGGMAAGNKQEIDRRWFGALGTRRRTRR